MNAEEKGEHEVGEGMAREPEQIREEIKRTRAEMGETVAAVADKADVKKQAQAKADQLKGQATAKVQKLGDKAKQAAPDSGSEGVQQAQRVAQENPVPLALVGAFLAGLVVGRLSSR
jgi:ElaB/YqjD/DUF883 family membrane-anchored ribosome-binding protein